MKKFAFRVLGIGVLWLLGFGMFGLAQTNQVHAQSSVPNIGGQFGQTNDTAGLGLAWAWDQASSGIIQILKNFINWTLGILGLIALVILLRGGFQMVTAAGDDEKYKKGFKILKQSAVGLIFIGLAFFMVSIILRLVGKVAWPSAWTTWTASA